MDPIISSVLKEGTKSIQETSKKASLAIAYGDTKRDLLGPKDPFSISWHENRPKLIALSKVAPPAEEKPKED